MLPQIQYDKALLGKMKSNYFNANLKCTTERKL